MGLRGLRQRPFDLAGRLGKARTGLLKGTLGSLSEDW